MSAGPAPGHKFPREARILTKAAFEKVFKSGQKSSCPAFAVYRLPSADGGWKIGIVTSRKIGGAVVRNAARRRLREMFRLFQGEFPGTPSELVVVVRDGAVGKSPAELAEMMIKLLSREKKSNSGVPPE